LEANESTESFPGFSASPDSRAPSGPAVLPGKNRMGAPRNYATACMLRPKVFSMRKKSGRYTMKIKDFGWAVLAVLGAIACGGGGSDTAEGADYAGGVGPGGAGS